MYSCETLPRTRWGRLLFTAPKAHNIRTVACLRCLHLIDHCLRLSASSLSLTSPNGSWDAHHRKPSVNLHEGKFWAENRNRSIICFALSYEDNSRQSLCSLLQSQNTSSLDFLERLIFNPYHTDTVANEYIWLFDLYLMMPQWQRKKATFFAVYVQSRGNVSSGAWEWTINLHEKKPEERILAIFVGSFNVACVCACVCVCVRDNLYPERLFSSFETKSNLTVRSSDKARNRLQNSQTVHTKFLSSCGFLPWGVSIFSEGICPRSCPGSLWSCSESSQTVRAKRLTYEAEVVKSYAVEETLNREYITASRHTT